MHRWARQQPSAPEPSALVKLSRESSQRMNEQENKPHLLEVGAGIPERLPCLAAHLCKFACLASGLTEGQSWQLYLLGALADLLTQPAVC